MHLSHPVTQVTFRVSSRISVFSFRLKTFYALKILSKLKTLLLLITVSGVLLACGNKVEEKITEPAQAPVDVPPTQLESNQKPLPSYLQEGQNKLQEGNNIAQTTHRFKMTEVTKFETPWAMTFLPDGRLLVTQMSGSLHVYDPEKDVLGNVSGVPKVEHVAQGGLGDVILHPNFSKNGLIYISYVEAGEGGLGAAVARAKLELDTKGGGALRNVEVIWRQVPKKSGDGHFGYRLAFDKEGYLWISSSERKEFDPAQDMKSNLGKILRLNEDGTAPKDNPFAAQGGVTAQIWSLGHRNILGLAFAPDGKLWAHEMGPKGGDELNLIEKGANYGYPIVSDGNHYDDKPIPNHNTRPEFRAPVISWTPVISPSGFIIYSGELFQNWKGNGFIGGMSSKSLVRIRFDGENAREVERFGMQRRIREVEQGPDGAIWLLEDGTREGNGWLLKLTPETTAF